MGLYTDVREGCKWVGLLVSDMNGPALGPGSDVMVGQVKLLNFRAIAGALTRDNTCCTAVNKDAQTWTGYVSFVTVTLRHLQLGERWGKSLHCLCAGRLLFRFSSALPRLAGDCELFRESRSPTSCSLERYYYNSPYLKQRFKGFVG